MQKKVLFVLGIILTILLSQQCADYRKNFSDFDNVKFQPTNEADNIPINWRYTVLYNLANAQKTLDKVSITIFPGFDHEIKLLSQQDIYTIAVGKDTLEEMRRKEVDSKGNIDQEAKDYNDLLFHGYPEDKNIVVERINKSYSKDTYYTITYQYKRWNFFSWLLRKNKLVFNFKTDTDPEDELTSRKEKFLSDLGSHEISVSGFSQYEKEREEKCPLWVSSIPNLTDGRQMKSKTSEYEIAAYNCGFLDKGIDTGENVTVRILNPDMEKGKQIFLEELEKYGLEIGPKLQVKFTR